MTTAGTTIATTAATVEAAPTVAARATVPAARSGTATVAPAGAASAAAAARFTPPIRPHRFRPRIGPFHLAQLVCWQVAAAAVLAAHEHGPVTAVVVGSAALPSLVPTVVRFRGRWLYQWLAVWLRYRTRRRKLPDAGGGRALDLLTFVEGSVTVESIEVEDQTAAMLAHRNGLCAVFELDPAEGAIFVDAARSLPSPAALLPAADPTAPPVAVQLLVHLTPAPWSSGGPGVVDRSYRELTRGEVPAHRRVWVAIQAVRTPDAYSDAQLRPVLAATVRRARRQLRQEHLPARLLNREELLAAVGYLAHLPGPAGSGNLYGSANGRLLGRETWQAWWSADAPQICRRLPHWPALPWQVDSLLRQLPVVGAVLSIAVTRDRGRSTTNDDIAVEAALRLAAANPASLTVGDRTLADTVRQAGGRTERMDGEHVNGLAATLPLGGFLS